MKIIDHRLCFDDGTPYPFVESPNKGRVANRPRWLVMHSTASAGAKEAIAWLTDKSSKSSAHAVIDKQGNITQLVPFNQPAWHAGRGEWKGVSGLNAHSIGIELENRLILDGGPGRWTFRSQPVDDAEVVSLVSKGSPRLSQGWDRYPSEQIRSAITLGRVLAQAYALEDVLGHEDISPGRKLDPGPAFPMGRYREQVIGKYPPAEALEPRSPSNAEAWAAVPAPDSAPASQAQTASPSSSPGAAGPTFRVEVATLNIRTGPGASHPTVKGSPLAHGARVQVLEEKEGWYRVRVLGPAKGLSNIEGWVSARFLTAVDTPPAAAVKGAEPPPAALPAESPVARLVPDHVGSGLLTMEDDALDIAPEVRALCHVLISHASRPPISVGLFGDWGTGKSFFMELMHAYIGTLADESRKAVAEGKESAFCTDVVQIRFNAWHYMDSNLWASLAARIFDGLWQAVREKEPEKHQELLQKLSESQGVLAEMESTRRAASDQLAQHTETVGRLTLARDAVQGRLGRQMGAAVRAGLDKVAQDPAFTGPVREAERLAGLPPESLAPESVAARIAELRSGWGRVRALWASLGTPGRALVAAAFLLVVLGVPLLAAWLSGRTALLASLASLAAIVAAASAVLARVGPWLARVPGVLARLEEANAVVQQQVQLEKEMERQRELADQQELLRLEQAVHAAAEAERQAAARVAAIQKEIEELRSGRQLQRFLQERGAGDDYRRHLGIISLIRNDFERLSELLRGLENEGPQAGMPSIDRIVLYIDDLDRCPENRVVEVLQAVHLLLAFPLFVVVVGVDSRWLLLSLEDHYSALRGRVRRGGRTRRLSTPQNYLEKIFQIPFTLRPMQSDGFGRLMSSLVTRRRPTVAEENLLTPEHVQSVQTLEPGAAPEGIVLTAAEHAAFTRAGDAPDDGDESGGDESGEHVEIDLTPPALELEAWEVDFMNALHPLIGSPRSAKRFVNVYQFLRARLGGEPLDRFRGTKDGGEHQVAALLLAALVGFPRESRPLFARLMNGVAAGKPWWAFVEEETSGATPSPDGEPLSADDAESRLRFGAALQAVRPACTFADEIGPFRSWAPTIYRFSFQSTQAGAAD